MTELPRDLDDWLADRDRSPLAHDRLMRYQYVGAGKSRDLDVIAEVDHDGNVVGARPLTWTRRRALRSLAARAAAIGPYVSPTTETRGGQYEIVTVMDGDDVHQVVFDNAERRELEILREAVEELR